MIRIDLLNDLRAALVALNSKNWKKLGFNMEFWARYKLPDGPELGCGTVCCAFGVGASLPSWRAAGIRMIIDTNYSEVRFRPKPVVAQEILGLTPCQWMFIFGVPSYQKHKFSPERISPDNVIAHIDQVLKNGTFFM